uniref:Putative YopX protein n=1 Tax=viral metagenome TaxID=1070528 RepID=A0A6M3JEK5_9ZZZZ
MRKYRGKTKDGKWVEGYYMKRLQGETVENGEIVKCYADQILPEDSYFAAEVIPASVGQSIDVRDKNKKEVYFDDIVLWNGKKWVVVWNKTMLGVYLQPLDNYIAHKNDPKKGRLIENLMYKRAVYLEVIGNTTDDPELLEG